MPALAIADDIAGMWRPLSAAEYVVATNWIVRASAMVRFNVPGLDARIVADPNLGVLAKGVVVDMVLRVLKNPDGKLEESIDDYRYRRDSATSSGALYLSAAEQSSLVPSLAGLGGAFVVSLGG